MPAQIVLNDVTLCVLQVVRLMVTHPADVKAEIIPDADHHNSLRITVHQEDLGFVIGRKGRTARSLRVLLAALANRLGLRVSLDIHSDQLVPSTCLPRP